MRQRLPNKEDATAVADQPYGVYLLVNDRTRAIAADFDRDDLWAPMEFGVFASSRA